MFGTYAPTPSGQGLGDINQQAATAQGADNSNGNPTADYNTAYNNALNAYRNGQPAPQPQNPAADPNSPYSPFFRHPRLNLQQQQQQAGMQNFQYNTAALGAMNNPAMANWAQQFRQYMPSFGVPNTNFGSAVSTAPETPGHIPSKKQKNPGIY
jgi:hypothetical protein